MSQNEADPGPMDAGGSAWRFRNWRVPTRLTAILLVPVVTGLGFAGLRVNDQISTYNAAGQNEKIAQVVEQALTVVHDLETERDSSLVPRLTGKPSADLDKAKQQTNQDILALQTAASRVTDNDALSKQISTFMAAQKSSLGQLRTAKLDSALNIIDAQQGYSNLIFPLMGTTNELSFSDNAVNNRGREIYALALAKASASTERYLVMVGLITKTFPDELIVAVKTANKLTSTALGQFQLSNIAADAALFKKTVSGNPDLGAPETNLFAVQANHEKLSKTGITPTSWYTQASQLIEQERTTEQALIKQVLDDTAQAKSDARQNAIVTSAEALGAVLLAGLLTFFISRSMVRSMRRLRDSAQAIANERLPDMVRRLSRTDPERVDTSVTPIPINSTDEIGEVARAFDGVHREAVRLASEQALLRGNVNAIFTNLSRRSHGLIERQLALITDLENNEADPDQLENLFKLDHLATRMRRNGENLLVLAGEEAGRQWGEPIPLVDVLRAAASEVEQYERIELSGIPETDVVGPAVTDLVHLLAELLENATTFSSPQTRVRVTATRLPDQRVLVEIHDKGIGLTASDFTEINAKLAEPPTVDASVSRQMGLFVVGRLAERHGIRVQLRPSGESAGTTSLVMLPEHLTQLPRVGEPEEQFTVSRIYPEAENAAYDPQGQPLRTADELGFDDTRYGRPAVEAPAEQTVPLGSVQRSLRLGQRREQAALSGPEAAAAAAPAPGPGPVEPNPMRDYGRDFDEYQPGSTQRYPSSMEPNYEAGRYTAQDFEAAAHYAPETPYPAQSGFAPGGPAGPQPQDPFGQHTYPGAFPAPAADGFAQQRPAAAFGGPGDTGSYQVPGADAFPARPGDTASFPAVGPNGLPQRQPDGGVGAFGGPVAPQGAGDTAALPAVGANGLPQRRPNGTAAGLPQRELGGAQAAFGAGVQPNGTQGQGTGDLPTRRPGAALGGRAIGERDAGERPNWFTGARDAGSAMAAEQPALPAQPSAPQREPAAGGTTQAGLPRRVPRQNLQPGQVPDPHGDGQGTTPPSAAAASQLSRSPEEVRGRLTNLRRGIQQGHSAGDTPSTGFGPYGTNPQER